MGNHRPIKTSCWERFLKEQGCKYVHQNASHGKWKCEGCKRPIIFWPSKKEVPATHIFTDLRTMNIPREVFLEWIKENC